MNFEKFVVGWAMLCYSIETKSRGGSLINLLVGTFLIAASFIC
jgi:hypothetical protein